jgi:hypothetical protein
VSFCAESGYYLLAKGADGLYTHAHTMDADANAMFIHLMKKTGGKYAREVLT